MDGERGISAQGISAIEVPALQGLREVVVEERMASTGGQRRIASECGTFATWSRSQEQNLGVNVVEPLLSIDLAVWGAVLRNAFAHPAQVREDPEVGR